jgi:hypothetical protein
MQATKLNQSLAVNFLIQIFNFIFMSMSYILFAVSKADMVVLPWQLWHMSIELINEFEKFPFSTIY